MATNKPPFTTSSRRLSSVARSTNDRIRIPERKNTCRVFHSEYHSEYYLPPWFLSSDTGNRQIVRNYSRDAEFFLRLYPGWKHVETVGERWARSEEESRRNETTTRKKGKKGERKEKKRKKIVLNGVAERNGVVACQRKGEAFRSWKSKDIDTITLPRANYQSA